MVRTIATALLVAGCLAFFGCGRDEVASWCNSALPGLTSDRSTDQTGHANSERRVSKLLRLTSARLDSCEAVTSIGLGKVSDDRGTPDGDQDYFIGVTVDDEEAMPPTSRVYLDGVRIDVEVGVIVDAEGDRSRMVHTP